MMEILRWGKALYLILQDGKITKEELPKFLEALAGLTAAVVGVLLPLLRADKASYAERLSEGLQVAADKAKE